MAYEARNNCGGSTVLNILKHFLVSSFGIYISPFFCFLFVHTNIFSTCTHTWKKEQQQQHKERSLTKAARGLPHSTCLQHRKIALWANKYTDGPDATQSHSAGVGAQCAAAEVITAMEKLKISQHLSKDQHLHSVRLSMFTVCTLLSSLSNCFFLSALISTSLRENCSQLSLAPTYMHTGFQIQWVDGLFSLALATVSSVNEKQCDQKTDEDSSARAKEHHKLFSL